LIGSGDKGNGFVGHDGLLLSVDLLLAAPGCGSLAEVERRSVSQSLIRNSVPFFKSKMP
jgi:hypothetical protein